MLVPQLRGAEHNAWPFWVGRDDGKTEAIVRDEVLGPIFEHRRNPDGSFTWVLRPLLYHNENAARDSKTSYLLYPFFALRREPDYFRFSFFALINSREVNTPDRPDSHYFDIWPIYFSRNLGDPARDYRALFPIAGRMKERFGRNSIEWFLFPLYSRVEDKGRTTTYTPWPFIRSTSGAGATGFGLWPLFSWERRPNEYRYNSYLWPLIYKVETNLTAPQPTVRFGVLPFYSSEDWPGYRSETYVWPFFGYTDRTIPNRYHERRYLWPLLVQGRGDNKYINRWAPFYSHSNVNGYDKTWVLWPLFRTTSWEEKNLIHRKDQFLYFVYQSLEQRSPTNPNLARAYKRHLWPLASVWSNGAGKRQVQLFEPLEVFFPHNEVVRQLYTPIFAIYRFDQRAPDDRRHSILWSLLSWHKSPTEKEFNLGPLFSTRSTPGRKRVAVGAGLLSWRREPETARWKFSLFDFPSRSVTKATKAATP
jgi:hypothetical protein